MEIIFEDESIIVVKKDSGEATQTANIAQKDLVSTLKKHISEERKIKNPYIGVVHRLDQPVKGLLVFALNEKSAAELSRQVNCGELKKYYYAVVENIPNDSGELIDYMYKDAKQSKSIITDKSNPKGKCARLKYKVITSDTEKNVSTLDIELITGRFHQIRAQLSNMGCPIVGDTKYGSIIHEKSGIELCAYRLQFKHPKTGKKMEYQLKDII